MTWSFSLGRLLGSELRVHVTFFLLLAWVGFAAYSVGGLPAAIDNLVFVLALFACVVAHEFGHALMARRYGIKTPDITLLPIGGLARLERMPEKPMQEVYVALAGPAVNIVIWIVLVALGAGTPFETFSQIDAPGTGLLDRLAYINLLLAAFNMIPAFPMDGGRVFRALLCLRMDRVKATRLAAIGGQIVAIGLGFLGLSTANPILVLIAVFVFIAANAESQDVALRSAARRVLARDAMITEFHALSPSDTLSTAAQAVIHTTQHEFPVLEDDSGLLGFVTRNRLFAALASDQPRSTSALSVMDADIPSVALTTGLEEVLEHLHKGAPAIAVVTQDGRMVGYITRENIGELMVIQGR
ncbi:MULTISPECIES: site-2 protease family protein [unclassified Ruegeria]|uniref:site-2 protease family protein n=1 Tax=unclassified Ruegeria TaxID=2625375 RepID=UPI00148950CC|nr:MULTISPECIES: site-2 protease family protein [unclassified Ruegeria]NOD87164.1 CBS domain-containing protein [Ruegeria sp. HKCCD4318]NOE12719.1 CBS domain-containing protein [Ruegeria sp. HKCCD4318-2]NOG09115.1 site-2 protease family protein [Ruegeria sp. HKCCD4315]